MALSDQSATEASGPQSQSLGTELWRHPAPESTQMWEFLQEANKEHGLNMKNYEELYQWSISNVSDFWAAVWQYTGIVASTPYEEVDTVLSEYTTIVVR